MDIRQVAAVSVRLDLRLRRRLFGLGLGLFCVGRLVLLRGLGGGRGLGLDNVGRRPQGQVVAKELHNEGAIPVRLLRQRIELGNSVVKGLLGQMAGPIGRVKDLVVKDREVEGQTKADGVRWRQLGLGNFGGALKDGKALH